MVYRVPGIQKLPPGISFVAFACIYWGTAVLYIYVAVYYFGYCDPKFKHAPYYQFEINIYIFFWFSLPVPIFKAVAFWLTRLEAPFVGFTRLVIINSTSAGISLAATLVLGPFIGAWALVDTVVTIALIKHLAQKMGYSPGRNILSVWSES